MLAGDVNFAIDNLTSYLPAIDSGKMRALAVTAAQRWPTMADVPTMEEAGMKDFVVTSWAAFVFPAGTPRPIIERLNRELRAAVSSDEMRERLAREGAEPIASTPEEYAADIDAEETKWSAIVKSLNLKIE